MAPNADFGKALQFITSIKLQELERQRSAYQEHLQKALEKSKTIDDPRARAAHLLEAVTSWKGSGATDETDNIGEGSVNLANLKMWLSKCDKDPSFSQEQIRHWSQLLEEHLQRNTLRFDCAKLFGEMLNEWIGSGDSATSAFQDPEQSSETAAAASDAFIDVGRKELHEQREKLESLIFDEHKVDTKVLKDFLAGLFADKQGISALKEIREALEKSAEEIQKTQFTSWTVKTTISNLITSDPLSEDQTATLKSFLDNDMILNELAAVLDMRLASIDSWTWPQGGILVEMRRALNGKYRFYTDPDTVDAILLHHLGILWQMKFKEACRKLWDSKAWKKLIAPILSVEKERYSEQLPLEDAGSSVDARRSRKISDTFFLSQLADSFTASSSYDDGSDDYGAGSGDAKRQLLHMLLAECYFHTSANKSFAVVRSDLEWFGPSIPHEAILTILEFFGVPEFWLKFFKTFLQTPLYFKGEPGNVRTRKRGTPIGYSLSAFFGEAILFSMDIAVNQKTGGCFLYRIHDDILLWDAKPERCATGWAEMQKFANLTGLKFNESKTGSAVVGNGDATGLPPGDIRWGFLVFNPSKVRFVIDQKDVDLHISELRRQLNATKSVFGWVNLLNKYMAFFLRNFGGPPTYAFGHDHVMDIIDTLARIQRELFPDYELGAVGHLMALLKKKWGVDGLPLGYFYLPVDKGGLGLRNPMFEAFIYLRSFDDDEANPDDDKRKDPQERLKEIVEEDEDKFEAAQERWKHQYTQKNRKFETFFTLGQYKSFREHLLSAWGEAYGDMFCERPKFEIKETPSILAKLVNWPLDSSSWASMDQYQKASTQWRALDWYQQWVISVYGEDMVRKFGGFVVVDSKLIPIGMVELFKGSRVKLDQ